MRLKKILAELARHAPFTALGAASGMILLLVSQSWPQPVAYRVFYFLHPMHVVLSAMVTASVYNLHTCEHFGGTCLRGKCNLWKLFLVGYIGSVGIATLSDCIIPFVGESLMQLPNRGIHLGFIEKWWIVNPLAIVGTAFAYFRPQTRFPHAGHVLLSTWASLFHMLLAMSAPGQGSYWLILVFLFLAVWLPCCLSDIVFPLLFAPSEKT
ncbi:MAG: hypothetical protein ACP5I4_04120 [Oceanipulchritudo sp.]